MTIIRNTSAWVLTLLLCGSLSGCFLFGDQSASNTSSDDAQKGRLVMFVGIDISGSFLRSRHFKDSLRFLARYLYAHLNGHGGLEVPQALFVGSIGGAKADEPKTFHPIQTFQYKDIAGIEAKLFEIFPKSRQNPITDYNAFFRQVATFVQNKKMVLRPITIVMMSDGIPDVPKKDGKHNYRSIKLEPLENLARNITLRLLYTTAEVGINWQTKVPRNRVKIWTQDANVMKEWDAPDIYQPKLKFPQKARFFSWVKDNVDFNVRRRRVQ